MLTYIAEVHAIHTSGISEALLIKRAGVGRKRLSQKRETGKSAHVLQWVSTDGGHIIGNIDGLLDANRVTENHHNY